MPRPLSFHARAFFFVGGGDTKVELTLPNGNREIKSFKRENLERRRVEEAGGAKAEGGEGVEPGGRGGSGGFSLKAGDRVVVLQVLWYPFFCRNLWSINLLFACTPALFSNGILAEPSALFLV